MKEATAFAVEGGEHCDPSVPLAEDPRQQLVQRIIASTNFARSAFLTNFLLYVCDRELRRKVEEITEYQIGVQALGRSASYNPGTDNIVRTYARILRKRLEEYFEGEGRDEPLRLSIPRGGYVPIFHAKEQTPAAEEIPDLPEAPYAPDPAAVDHLTISLPPIVPGRWSPRFLVPRTQIGMAAVLALAAGVSGMHSCQNAQQDLSHQLWKQIFGQGRQTLVVPADSSLGILENLTGHPVNLADYVTGTYLTGPNSIPGIDARNWQSLRTQRYTSVVDLNIAVSLSHLPEFAPDHAAIRYARDLSLDDLKHVNAVLLGSIHTNPWIELFQNQLNFSLEYHPEVDDSLVINRHPLPGESPVYKNDGADNSHVTYAVLAFIPSLDGAGHVILVEGLTMAGTQAAADLLLNKQDMNPILRKALRSDGHIRPFELLLETTSIGANAPEARVIAERYSSR
jgi:hypothetical protein